MNQRNGSSVVGNAILARTDELLWQELNQARMLVNAILFINYQTDIGAGELAGLSLMLNNAEKTSSIAQAALDTSIAACVIRPSRGPVILDGPQHVAYGLDGR